MAMRLGSSYTLESLVGRGGMGEVWRGHDQSGRVLAFKLLLPELTTDERIVARFMRERSVLTRIQSPFVVKVWDLVAEHGRLAIVMDFIEGSDLRQYLRSRGTLPPAEAVALTGDVLTGLGVAHDLGIVHRDLKPANVLLGGDSPALHPRVTDFGIAAVMDASTELTTSQGILGTPTYMAPEMVSGGEVGPPADVYAAGIVLYELLSGVTPFAGLMPLAVMRAHVDLLPGRPPGLDDALWAVISAMLAKNPADRPGMADLRALQPGLEGRPAQPPLGSPPPAATGPQPAPAGPARPQAAAPLPPPDPVTADPVVSDPVASNPVASDPVASNAHGGYWRRVPVFVAVVAVVLTLGATALERTLRDGPDPAPRQNLAASDPGPVRPSTAAASSATTGTSPVTGAAASATAGATSATAEASSATAEPGSAGPAAPAAGTGSRPAPGSAAGPGTGNVSAGNAVPVAEPVAPRSQPPAGTAGDPATAPAPAAPAAQSATKSWADTATGACLDSDGARIYTLDCNGGDWQRWTRDGLRFRNLHTGTCMASAAGGHTADGTQIPDSLYATTCDGSAGQQWAVASSTRFGQAFRNVATGNCLDSNHESPNGTGYQAYTLPCSGNNYQNWT
ncbi:putative Serine/threonine protein kinase pkaA (protein kinase A) [Frankia alni ACN14a]|uniref:non-specific serine/threonine protein kinase n=2 Tax=Frankiaceae TaxID=74712 RepID=Q0RF20_FRAAA|nr:putative Serine/threonine protein kinase pkaA (protein kinase A) [Frankia alni ACN14a]